VRLNQEISPNEINEISASCPPKDLPEFIEVDLSSSTWATSSTCRSWRFAGCRPEPEAGMSTTSPSLSLAAPAWKSRPRPAGEAVAEVRRPGRPRQLPRRQLRRRKPKKK
jgi:hypothetical protein